MDSVLRPRDIQARIRAGETPEDVAAAAQTSVDKIMGFATPVLAERAYQAELAQKASVRRRTATGFERHNIDLPPRALYLLSGEVRWEWEHSIVPMAMTRRSITFRSLRYPLTLRSIRVSGTSQTSATSTKKAIPPAGCHSHAVAIPANGFGSAAGASEPNARCAPAAAIDFHA